MYFNNLLHQTIYKTYKNLSLKKDNINYIKDKENDKFTLIDIDKQNEVIDKNVNSDNNSDNNSDITEKSIEYKIEESEIESFSSNEECFRNLGDSIKFDKENMCNTCNTLLIKNGKYKCFKIKNNNGKFRYYCLKCGFEKKSKKKMLYMILIYKDLDIK